jgi:two-component system OmpR family response regulator
LVVEDDETAAAAFCRALEEHGYQFMALDSADKAMQALGSGVAFAALVVDVNLGRGETGYAVARLARQADPELPVIYVSGEPTLRSWETFGVPGSRYLAKPFRSQALLDLLQTLLPAPDA